MQTHTHTKARFQLKIPLNFLQHRRDAFTALKFVEHIIGVKGVSLTMTIPNFDPTKCFPPEYLQCALLGFVKSFFLFEWIQRMLLNIFIWAEKLV